MADFGPVPEDLFGDKRATHASPSAFALAVSICARCSARGRIDADPWELCRLIARRDVQQVAKDLAELERRGWLRLWEAPDEDGIVVKVAGIVRYHDYTGLPDGRRYRSKAEREKKRYPDPPEEAGKRAGSTPEESGKDSGSGLEDREERREKREERSSRVDTRATLSPSGDTWPLGTEEAGKAYLAKQIATANAMGRTTTIAPSTVRLIAQRHPDTFALAAIGLVELADTKPECMTASPHKWLLQRCENPPTPKAKPPPKLEARQCGPAPEPSPEWLINWRGAEVSPQGVAKAEVLAGPEGYFKREERPALREHPEALAWVCEQYGWRPEEVAA